MIPFARQAALGGTGDGHRLDCKPRASDENLESYLNGPFNAAAARVCRDELQKKYDLSQYTTPNFADDIDEVRVAMGYDKINLNAGSFGTYAAQIYMRRHPEHSRTAYLASLVTMSDRVPLYHARGAQSGLDELFKDCEQDSGCHSAYPRLREAGYSERFASALIVSECALDNLIPPSIAFILYGIATETSIGRLFLAGVMPGLMLTGLFMLWTLFII